VGEVAKKVEPSMETRSEEKQKKKSKGRAFSLAIRKIDKEHGVKQNNFNFHRGLFKQNPQARPKKEKKDGGTKGAPTPEGKIRKTASRSDHNETTCRKKRGGDGGSAKSGSARKKSSGMVEERAPHHEKSCPPC